MKKIMLVVIAILCLCGCENTIAIQTIQGEVLYEELEEKQNVLLFDVRSKEEFEQGHIKDALNVPVDEIDKDMMQIYNKNTKVVVYCQSGNRSHQAALKLKKLGFQYVYDLGGIHNWQYELVKSTDNKMN